MPTTPSKPRNRRSPTPPVNALVRPISRRKVQRTRRKVQRTVAKAGMTGSISALLISGFFKFKGAKTLHLYAGFGLVAFSLWHHLQHMPPRNRRRD